MLDKIPTELKYVLIMAAIVLFQYMLKRFGPQPVESAPAEPEQAPEGLTQTLATPVEGEGVAEQFGRTGVPRASESRTARQYSRKSLMGTGRKTREAVVIATILGPCRAFESHDSRQNR